MAEALGHLNRISCHFRKHGQHKSANELGKLSIMIVNAFSEGVEHIPDNEYMLDEDHMHSSRSMTAEDQQRAMHESIQKQAVAALLNEVEKEKKEPVRGHGKRAGSWAEVASSMGNVQGQPKDTMHYLSPMSMSSVSGSKQSHENEDENGLGTLDYAGVSLPQDIPEVKAGVVRIHGRVTKDMIHFITARIHEGPLQDIRLESNGMTQVAFQFASHALAFVKSNQEMEEMLGYGRFGTGYNVELAEVIDWDDDHRRMNQPVRERRRLSFARKRLFADNMSPEKWKQDIRALAGPGNIDFLWVFNSGNATAVFASTVVARRVLEAFNKWKNTRSVYSGVSVTYSSDPCEKELVLVKDMGRPAFAKNYAKKSMR
ncbi:uncharacterized protein ACLA_091430 [Aspergillus clavatus NRRL 1]|uniref:Uncharacterized protein n=1 Tax=Aspergillus clavatus (strain ATCC 1007 / CBS 513.65 / DSM 816 / NCTC 3887 / NRRL 1 / QM 1276 / 107) TaxID=344612 RepID=A1CEZ6_ASPCL|nr:uncharacterized protein ACLA_091430 [Aspergillus clavatus NRRL 1]EAW11445.1 conserved hypothetical protein [Aspergillus clavatus NRRL 1]